MAVFNTSSSRIRTRARIAITALLGAAIGVTAIPTSAQ